MKLALLDKREAAAKCPLPPAARKSEAEGFGQVRSYTWGPLADDPPRPAPRGLLAHLTSFLIAYHTA